MICTYGADALRKLAGRKYPSVEGVGYLISRQLPEGEPDAELPAQFIRDDIEIYTHRTSGLSANRNQALLLARGEIVLIADDDVDYTADGLRKVIRTFERHPEADIITFKYASELAPKWYPSETFNLAHPAKGYFISSIEIAFRLDKIKGVEWFSTAFGIGGSRFKAGEESLFVEALLHKGFVGVFEPNVICIHNNVTTTDRLLPYDNGSCKGALCAYSNPTSWPLRMVVNALRDCRRGEGNYLAKIISYIRGWLSGAKAMLTDKKLASPPAPEEAEFINETEKYHRHHCADGKDTYGEGEDCREGHRPRFSIVIPAHNADKYLEATLDSVAAQTFDDYEIIAVDDCSTDDTATILSNEKERTGLDVKMMSTDESAGNCYKPRCVGSARASGEYIVPLDADDILAPDFLELLDRCIRETGADLVYGDMYRFEGDNPLTTGVKILPAPEVDKSLVRPGRENVILTLDGWKIGTGGAYRKDLYMQAIKKADKVAVGAYAVELLTRIVMAMSERMAFCDAGYYYRMTPGSITTAPTSRSLEYLDIDVRLRPIIDGIFGNDSKEAAALAAQTFHDTASALRRLGNEKFASDSDREAVRAMARRAYASIDRRLVIGRVSDKYRIIMSTGFKTAGRILGRLQRLGLLK